MPRGGVEPGAESVQPSASRHISHLLSVVCIAFPSTCRRSLAVCNEGFPSAAAPIKMANKRDHGGSSPPPHPLWWLTHFVCQFAEFLRLHPTFFSYTSGRVFFLRWATLFLVSISISELDGRYHGEAGGHVECLGNTRCSKEAVAKSNKRAGCLRAGPALLLCTCMHSPSVAGQTGCTACGRGREGCRV